MPHKDPEKRKQYLKEYYAKNHQRLRAKHHAYYLIHKKAWRDYRHNERKNYPERNKAQQRRTYQRKRTLIVNRLGGKCSKCGFSDNRILEIHHITGAPQDWRRNLTKVSYIKIEQALSNHDLILLCPNCHALSHLNFQTLTA